MLLTFLFKRVGDCGGVWGEVSSESSNTCAIVDCKTAELRMRVTLAINKPTSSTPPPCWFSSPDAVNGVARGHPASGPYPFQQLQPYRPLVVHA